MWVIILFIHHFSKKSENNYSFYLYFIDNEKGISHFKFASLDYDCSGIYLQKCKATGNQTLFVASSFSLKVGMSKND